MSRQLILCCEDTMEGIFTAIYDAFVYKKRMTEPYTDSIEIQIGGDGNYRLFAEDVRIDTDQAKAEKTIWAIQKKLGFSLYQTVFYALCHYDEERASMVLGYLVRGFATGSRIREHLSDPYVMRVMELSRKVANECQKLYGFLRFRDAGNFLFSEIEPKCNVLPILIEHFSDRYPNENFIIYDRKHGYAVVHAVNKGSFFVQGEELTQQFGDVQDVYEELWKQYFRTMAIDERQNEACQNNMLPKWYRKTMLEFKK